MRTRVALLAALAVSLSLACASAPAVRPAEPAPEAAKAAPALAPRPATRTLAGEDAKTVVELEAVAAQLRGLDFTSPVRAESGDGAMVRWLVDRELAEERASGSFAKDEAMLRAFGFVAPDADLAAILEAVMGEQARGIYDHRDRILYVIDGAPAAAPAPEQAQLTEAGLDERRMVLLHELTHALDDQHFHLARFVEDGLSDDTALAYRALVEGDATYVMYDYVVFGLARRHLADLPGGLAGLRGQLDAAMGADSNAALREAPAYLRESLVFSYLDGVSFVDALQRNGGWAAVDRAWASPPTTTEQILHPEKYLAGEAAAPVEPPKSAVLAAKGYRVVSSGTQGELGLRIFLEGLRDAAKAAGTDLAAAQPDLDRILANAGWGGDAYTIYARAGAPDAALWVVAFDAPEGADAFLRAAGPLAPARGVHVRRLGPSRVGVVTFVDDALAEEVLTPLADRR